MRKYVRIAKALVISAIAAGILSVLPAVAQETSHREETKMRIIIRIENKSLTASLNDSEAARSFASLLPLRLTLKDYAATEKIADLPSRLTTEGAPAGYEPAQGDITYYAPWGNLAIFYKDFAYSRGLVHLGKIDSGLDLLGRSRSFEATIELQMQ